MARELFRRPFEIKRPKNKILSGLTLLEIVVATVILALVLVGLLNVFTVGKRYVLHSRSVMVAAELGRYFLDPLQNDVREDTWNNPTNNLSVKSYNGASISIQNINFTPQYHVYDVGLNSTSPIRKVRVDIVWNDTSP
jgi:Tfp pilus assembly protein PilW